MNTLPLSSTAALSSPLTAQAASSSSTGSSSSGSTQTTANLASQNVFLQLLVAQLKNQDPSQPTDGTQFVTELAQFTTLQEDTNSSNDLDKIVASLNTTGTTTTTAASTAAALNGLTGATANTSTNPAKL